MLKVGITGGIGSGKTTVCRIFETLGVPVYYADDAAKWLMANDAGLQNNIRSLLGEEAYFPEGQLNKAFISGKIFNNPDAKQALEQIVHPAVFAHFSAWLLNQKSPYILKEAALLIESGSYKTLDKIICVTAPQHLRIARVMQRDKLSRKQVITRLNAQKRKN